MTRTIAETTMVKEALEGAGVRLRRGFGYGEVPRYDPFLLFDDFSGNDESDYRAGFPYHPHRGIETVTYVLKGDVTHRDSLGNAGTIGPGDIQWMTAGSGIIHEEMPRGTDGLVGFQLWVNLPKAHKMMKPRYQEIKAVHIPVVKDGGTVVRVIAGMYKETRGPVEDIMAKPTYLDIELNNNTHFETTTPRDDTAFLYIIDGSLIIDDTSYHKGTIVRFENDGDTISFASDTQRTRLLFVSGTPLGETVAWHGPIVMNTDDEIRVALYDLKNGTFIKQNA